MEDAFIRKVINMKNPKELSIHLLKLLQYFIKVDHTQIVCHPNFSDLFSLYLEKVREKIKYHGLENYILTPEDPTDCLKVLLIILDKLEVGNPRRRFYQDLTYDVFVSPFKILFDM